jgi:SAM-dependent methyltransferase
VTSSEDDYPELRGIRFDGPFLTAVQELASQLSAHIDWKHFGRIPGRRESPGLRNSAVRTAASSNGRYAFLERSAGLDALIAELAATRGQGAALVFRLLCLSEFVSAETLESVLPQHAQDRHLSSGTLIRRGNAVAAALRFVPYGEHFYLTDSLLLGDNRLMHGMQPVYLNFETHEQVLYLTRLLGGRPVRRSLEVGCGTGLISLELRALVPEREGVDLHQRSVEFATLNAKLRGDAQAVFYQSDLLANCQGSFDLVFFNPFQFTTETLGFARTFLDQAFAAVGHNGIVVLVFHAEARSGRDTVFDSIVEHCASRGRSVKRTFFDSAIGRDGWVHSISFLRMEAAGAAPQSRTEWNWSHWTWLLRVVKARLRP